MGTRTRPDPRRPTLELLSQTAREYAACGGAGRIGAVCSDAGATVEADELTRDLARVRGAVSTDPAVVAGWLEASGRVTTLVTYQSLPVVAQAHRGYHAPGWDLVIVDEAHRSAGRVDRAWHLVHEDMHAGHGAAGSPATGSPPSATSSPIAGQRGNQPVGGQSRQREPIPRVAHDSRHCPACSSYSMTVPSVSAKASPEPCSTCSVRSSS